MSVPQGIVCRVTTARVDLEALHQIACGQGNGSHARLHRLFGAPPWICFYCQQPVVCSCVRDPWNVWPQSIKIPRDQATLDHRVPKSAGGRDVAANIVVACHHCNCSKGVWAFPCEWIPHRDAMTSWVASPTRLVDLVATWHGMEALGLAVLLDRSLGTVTVAELADQSNTAPHTLHVGLRRLAEFGFARRIITPRPPWRHVYFPTELADDGRVRRSNARDRDEEHQRAVVAAPRASS